MALLVPADPAGLPVLTPSAASSAAAAAMSNCNGSGLPPDYEEPFQGNFLRNHVYLTGVVLVGLIVVGATYCINLWWWRIISRLHHRAKVHARAEEFAMALLRHFAPTLSGERYQFRSFHAKRLRISISFEELGFRLPNGTQVLHGVTGEFKAGRVAAVLGPSGAGKTTFLNVLSGKASHGEATGKVYINGQLGSLSLLQAVRGYVPQDDIVKGTLTVAENIAFAALLRSRRGSNENVHDVVQDVLEVMQLLQVSNSLVGSIDKRGISGGQRKRVNIGIELAGKPTILFLDEPTSGLDASSSQIVVTSLKRMAQLGMTIIMTVHQPRYAICQKFDDMTFLGFGGVTVYAGSADKAPWYFEQLGYIRDPHDNPADWILDIISGETRHPTQKAFSPHLLADWWSSRKPEVAEAVASRKRAPVPGLAPDLQAKTIAFELEAAWPQLDHDGDGRLNSQDIEQLLSTSAGPESEDLEAIDLLMDNMGAGRGGVDREDFEAFLLDTLAGVRTAKDSDMVRLSELAANTWFTFRLCSRRRNPIRMACAGDYAEGDEDEEDLFGDDDEEDGSSEETASLSELKRPVPGFCDQFQIIFFCHILVLFRMNLERAMDLSLILGCTLVAGWLHQDENQVYKPFMPFNLFIFHLGLALLVCISCLKVFGNDRQFYWRMCAGGLNRMSFLCARALGNTFDVLLQTVIYCSIYYVITAPMQHFRIYFQCSLLIAWVGSGWGYLLSVVLPPENAVLGAVIFILVLSGLMGMPQALPRFLDGTGKELFVAFSITRWSLPMLLLPAIETTQGLGGCLDHTVLMLGTLYGSERLPNLLGVWSSSVVALLAQGLVLHLGAYLALRLMHRSRQV